MGAFLPGKTMSALVNRWYHIILYYILLFPGLGLGLGLDAVQPAAELVQLLVVAGAEIGVAAE